MSDYNALPDFNLRTTDSSYEDRRVHVSAPGIEIVRYDRAGKWYVEIAENYGRHGLPAERKAVQVREAALHARGLIARGATHHVGLTGGHVFDRLVARAAVARREGTQEGK